MFRLLTLAAMVSVAYSHATLFYPNGYNKISSPQVQQTYSSTLYHFQPLYPLRTIYRYPSSSSYIPTYRLVYPKHIASYTRTVPVFWGRSMRSSESAEPTTGSVSSPSLSPTPIMTASSDFVSQPSASVVGVEPVVRDSVAEPVVMRREPPMSVQSIRVPTEPQVQAIRVEGLPSAGAEAIAPVPIAAQQQQTTIEPLRTSSGIVTNGVGSTMAIATIPIPGSDAQQQVVGILTPSKPTAFVPQPQSSSPMVANVQPVSNPSSMHIVYPVDVPKSSEAMIHPISSPSSHQHVAGQSIPDVRSHKPEVMHVAVPAQSATGAGFTSSAFFETSPVVIPYPSGTPVVAASDAKSNPKVDGSEHFRQPTVTGVQSFDGKNVGNIDLQ